MISRCLEQSSSFGVVLIRSGEEIDPNDPFFRQSHADSEIGTPDHVPTSTVPYSIGTSVRITECHRLDDGRYYLSGVGQRRFRVQYIAQQEPYLVASVAFLPDELTPELPALGAALRKIYARYWQAIAIVTGEQHVYEELPEDPLEVSYVIANQLRVDRSRKQHWLESDPSLRLRELTISLRNELALMPGKRPDNGEPWARY